MFASFPVLEAPNALEHLSGMTLTETFRDFVFGDPQWEVLRRRAKAKGDKILEPSHQHLLYSAFWPTDCGQGDWPGMLFYLNSHPGSVGHLADLVVGRRFSRLINYLSSGQLLANGTAVDGKTVEVPRSLWARRQTHIDVSNGDLIEYRENARERSEWYSEPIFKGIILRKAEEMFPVKHIEHAQLLPSASVSPGAAAISPTRPKSPRRRPVADAVAQALKKHGVEREPGPRTYKEIAAQIAPDLSKQPKNIQEWNALITAVKRHYKQYPA